VAGIIFVTTSDGPDGPVTADSIRTASDVESYDGDVRDGGAAELLVSPSQDAALITFSDLPPSGWRTDYQLWIVDELGQATPVHDTFEPAEDGSASAVITPFPEHVTVAMTSETDPDPTVPTIPLLVQLPGPE
jgi:hypothetical protein